MLMASSQFISSRGNEYFCEIDEDYLTDRFNLTGLNVDVQYYQHALDLITDVFDLDCDDDMREQVEKSARHLYGLVHARYITTTRGLAKMVRPTVALLLPHLLTLCSAAGEIQESRLWEVSARHVRRPPAATHRSVRQRQHAVRQALLWQMRGPLQPQIEQARQH